MENFTRFSCGLHSEFAIIEDVVLFFYSVPFGYEWLSCWCFDGLAIRYGCGLVGGDCECVLTPLLCSRVSCWDVFFSLLLGFGFVFRLVLGVVWYFSA